jgi:RNA polymerase sigma factor (TIGR02999 family)
MDPRREQPAKCLPFAVKASESARRSSTDGNGAAVHRTFREPCAAEQLLPLVYDELRRLAAQRLANETPDQTLQPTALVHEAYLRLVNGDGGQRWNGRGHFFGAAAEAMRRILVENARRKGRHKRGGDRKRVSLDQADFVQTAPPGQLLALNEALEQLAADDESAALLVKLRFFGGFSIEQAGETLEISRAAAYRLWSYARAWLHCALRDAER